MHGAAHIYINSHGRASAGAFGKKAALLTLIGDMLKTVISILFAALLFGFQYVGGVSSGDGLCYIAGMFAILGHIFPIYYRFKGGKGVLCTATMALILSPIPFLIVFLIVPGILTAITAVWFSICGVIDLRAMFRDLASRVANPLDDGRVEGNMSLADKAQLEALEQKPDKKSSGSAEGSTFTNQQKTV